MSFGQEISQLLSTPLVAYLLLIVGINAFLVELGNPGIGFAAGLGGVCIALALYGLSILNANVAGLALMALALGLFIVDVKASTHGALTAGGLLAMVTGSVLLFSTTNQPTPWAAIIGASFATALVFIFVVQAAWRVRSRPVATGVEALIGKVGEARTDLTPEGSVWVYGSLWRGMSLDGSIACGEAVRVMQVEGLTLYVIPAAEEWDTEAPQEELPGWGYLEVNDDVSPAHQEEGKQP
ncbi:MAG: NfeD family protein [Anaerolineae bacterium]